MRIDMNSVRCSANTVASMISWQHSNACCDVRADTDTVRSFPKQSLFTRTTVKTRGRGGEGRGGEGRGGEGRDGVRRGGKGRGGEGRGGRRGMKVIHLMGHTI